MASYNALNPIRSIDGNYVPVPSRYQYSLQDVSAPNSGRTEDALMHKQRITQKVKIELEWANQTTAAVSEILNAFNPEYIQVRYLDAKAGDFVTKTFYVGDRAAPLYNSRLGLWENVAFNIIER